MDYLYDDCGVLCRLNPDDETDIQPCEPHCLNCGSPTLECDCGDYKAGWFRSYDDVENWEDNWGIIERVEGLREKIDSRERTLPQTHTPQTENR
jgi:hypothetical protein